MLLEYFNIYFFFVLSFLISIALYVISFVLVLRYKTQEKLSAYECGFDPFQDARVKFDVRFYLVAILFIIFDLEIMFLFPWVVALKYLNVLGFVSMFVFLFILGLGFWYEWRRGGLDWN